MYFRFYERHHKPSALEVFLNDMRYINPRFTYLLTYLLTKVARRRRPAEAQCTRSLGLGCKLCAVIPVAGQWTHGTTFRSLKVTSQVATPGAESAVCD